MQNFDPRQIITPLVLVGLGLVVGEGLGLGNQVMTSMREVIIWQGVKIRLQVQMDGYSTSLTLA